MRTIGINVIGFGRIAELTHIPLLGKMQAFELRGLFDVTEQRRALAAKRGLRVYADLDKLLDDEAETVLIATPPSSHYELAAMALRKGKHVLLEKPAALNAAEAEALRELADAHGRIVSVFHNRRFDDDVRLVREVMDSGRLGSIQYAERRLHQFGSGASFGVQSFHPGWREETAFGGGALLDWGVHLADQLLRLNLGSWQSVGATMHRLRWNKGDAEDAVQARILLDTGVLLSLDIHFGSHVRSPLWIVGGERGTLVVADGGEATLYAADGQATKVKPRPEEPGSYRKDLEGVKRIYAAFAARLAGEGELAVTLDEAVETLRLLDAIRASAAKGKEAAHGHSVRGSAVGI